MTLHDAVAVVLRRMQRQKNLRLARYLAGLLGTTVLMTGFVAPFSRTGALIVAFAVAASGLALLFRQKFFASPSRADAATLLDRELQLKDRAATLLSLETEIDVANNRAKADFISSQLDASLVNFHPPSNFGGGESKVDRYVSYAGAISLLCGIVLLLLFMKPRFSNPQALEIAKLVDEQPALPPQVVEALSELAQALEENSFSDPKAIEALARAEEEIQQAQEALKEMDAAQVSPDQQEKDPLNQNEPTPTVTPEATPTPSSPPEEAQQKQEQQKQQEQEEKQQQQEQQQQQQSQSGSQNQGAKQQSDKAQQQQKDKGEKGEGEGQGEGKGSNEGGSQKQGEQKSGQGGEKGDQKQQDQQSGQSGAEGSSEGQQQKDKESKSGEGQGKESSQQQDGKDGQSGSQGNSSAESQALSNAQQKLDQLKQQQKSDSASKNGKGEGKQPQKSDTQQSQGEGTKGAQQKPDQAEKPGSQGETSQGKSPPPESDKSKDSKPRDSDSNQDKDQQQMAEQSSKSRTKGEAKEWEDSGGDQGKGLGGQAEFQESEIQSRDEKFDTRFTEEKGDLATHKGEATPKTKLRDLSLAKPETEREGDRQPIPLEYRDIIQ